MTHPTVEHERLGSSGAPDGRVADLGPWALWGPYVAERAWGTVREDYSADGEAWSSFPHDHARSRAYRWNEDGMAAICDLQQRLCLGLALWNGRDPILKERMFGLSGPEGNHGEDVKEYWWYTDALPSHALLKWRYHYPQQAYPYDELVRENARRDRSQPEYELLDTGVFDHGTWIVETTYAKVAPTDTLMRVTVRNAGAATERIHVLPTLWFRNTWTPEPGSPRPLLSLAGDSIRAEHETLGAYVLEANGEPTALFCENETNTERLYGVEPGTAYPKDGINDHVIAGAATVSPDARGTKAAFWYVADVEPGETFEIRLRLREASRPVAVAFDETFAARQAEADAFYATLAPADATADEKLVQRQAFAGMIWSKQYYAYDVERWLAGDPGSPAPPDARRAGRNAQWRHMDVADILAMPDPWEYPWFAAWDLAFHAVVLAHVDSTFAKYQLIALTREWYMHPNGALPAYEWTFDDVNPPVHAWAALMVYGIDGRRDRDFLAHVFHKLLLNFTWWVNREDADGSNLFEGGFLGLDNISPFDRSNMPVDGLLEQSDATAWMAGYCLAMLTIALELAREDRAYDGLVTKFVEHFTTIVRAMNREGLWDEEDGFFYDRLRAGDGREHVLRYQSLVGVIPLLASISPDGTMVDVESIQTRFAAYTERLRGVRMGLPEVTHGDADGWMLSLVGPQKLRRVLADVLDEDAFLSPYGLRSLSKRHAEQPFTIEIDGMHASVDYEPAESSTSMFGGNSNWRGPVWFPVNVSVLESLERVHHALGDEFRVECPTGSGQFLTLQEVADELRRRLIAIFTRNGNGGRPVNGGNARFDSDPDWCDLISFHEYFHGDDGSGLGASHQTGWTGLVAHLIAARRAW